MYMQTCPQDGIPEGRSPLGGSPEDGALWRNPVPADPPRSALGAAVLLPRKRRRLIMLLAPFSWKREPLYNFWREKRSYGGALSFELDELSA